MVRLGPSASNKQPWRVMKNGDSWHFFLARTRGYGQGRFRRTGRAADMQRLDMGIAMCHFELAARELGLDGRWVTTVPVIDPPAIDDLTEYTASWVS
jgi:nitroreductase